MEKIRLNKFIAQCGVCSRREADKLIENKKITVNGEIAVAGTKVDLEDEVIYEGKRLSIENEKVVLAFNKPVGVTCTENDPHAEKIITDFIDYPVRVTYAGRLDKDSEGLILLTNDGDLIDGLMRSKNFHEKEYIVKINKEVTDDFINSMEEGVCLKELGLKTRKCKVSKLSEREFSIILTQGVNRQIRRMCKELNTKVLALKRVRVANIRLASLKTGEYRKITGEELHMLYNIVNNNSDKNN